MSERFGIKQTWCNLLELPDVTLVMIETLNHELARRSINESVSKAKFAEVLIFTDRDDLFFPLDCDARFIHVENWPTKVAWCNFRWSAITPFLKTSHYLMTEWDAWIWQPGMWRDDFLNYDYIGAPWWYKDGKNVGNGGFSLVSTCLKRYITDRLWDYPCDSVVDDDLLCRTYRPKLELAGFEWAPERLAHEFAFECSRPSDSSNHFGFHAMFNWPHVLSKEQLLERLKIASQSKYIKDSYIWKTFSNQHPKIIQELMELDNGGDYGISR